MTQAHLEKEKSEFYQHESNLHMHIERNMMFCFEAGDYKMIDVFSVSEKDKVALIHIHHRPCRHML